MARCPDHQGHIGQRRCPARIDEGADGIAVSNHGGRQLDGASSTISALPRIADAVAGERPILLDSGVRSGLHILKALAAGADACMVGRPWAYALAAGGSAGVSHMIEILRTELTVAMALTGCTDVRMASRALLEGWFTYRPRSPRRAADQTPYQIG